MLAIRMQRTGRSGHAQYRVIVQDSHQSPSSGKVVAMLGSYNPHTKEATVVKEKAEFYLKNGAQPSPRVVRLFAAQKIALPEWVAQPLAKEGKLRNPEKLRKNRPAEEAKPVEEAAVTPPEAADEEVSDTPAEETGAEAAPSEAPAEEATEPAEAETPAAE